MTIIDLSKWRCAPVAGPAHTCRTAVLQCCWRLSRRAAGSSPKGFRSWLLQPNWLQNGGKLGAKWLPGGFLEHLGLLEPSCSGLRGLLERSWTALRPKKSSLERLLAGPRGILREVSAILGAKRLPKRTPKGWQIELERRLELKMAKP